MTTIAITSTSGLDLVDAEIVATDVALYGGVRYKAFATVTVGGVRYGFYRPAPKSASIKGGCCRCNGTGIYGDHGVCFACNGSGVQGGRK